MATMTKESIRQAATDAGDETMTAVQKLREQADAAVQRIQPQIAAVSTYARNEPTKALLISAATGAALMGVVALLIRSGGRSSVSSFGSSAMAAIRDAALELADSAQSMAADALDTSHKRAADALGSSQKRAADVLSTTQKRAADALDSTQKRAAAVAETVSESVADAWKKVRDQAAPVVEKVKPQIDAATAYVKEDPTRAAIGLAAAGAIVAGLIALARQSQNEDEAVYY